MCWLESGNSLINLSDFNEEVRTVFHIIEKKEIKIHWRKGELQTISYNSEEECLKVFNDISETLTLQG